jgi:amino acid transporter
MDAGPVQVGAGDHLRERSIGLPQVLFQSVTHMAPAGGVAFSLLVAVGFAGPALPLAVLLALVACVLVGSSIGQLAKQIPSAGGLYAYVTRALGPKVGFMTGWLFLLFQPLVAPLVILIFAWATQDVFQHDIGWDYTGQWWVWVLFASLVVFFLTYRDVRLSTNAGILLGLFEIGVFVALSLWMIFSNWSGNTIEVFNPSHALDGTVTGTFKGMVFAILAFIGFEASAPLSEEARRPRWTVPRAVVLSALGIGIFFLLASYAWVVGTGFDDFVKVTLDPNNPNPWRRLATIFWGGGWVLIFLAIVNSAIANANAAVNSSTRVLYAMGRNGVLPRALARTHPRYLTPYVAILAQSIFGLALALLAGWRWGPFTAFVILATATVIVVLLIYMTVCIASSVFYWRQRRSEFNVFLHLVFPALGALAFIGPLYYQYHPLPPYPIRYANWIAIAWVALGVFVTAWMARYRREALINAGRIFVREDTAATALESPPAPASGSLA